jgi:hypothetical protein
MATDNPSAAISGGKPADIIATLVGFVPAGLAVSTCPELAAVELILRSEVEDEPTRLLLTIEACCDLAMRLTAAAVRVRRAADAAECQP